MSIPTIEIATAIHTALRALTWPDGWSVYARGVKTAADGTPDDTEIELKRVYPFAQIEAAERFPAGYGSALRAFGLKLRVTTHFPSDEFQTSLYEGADVMAGWMCGRPQLSLSSVVFVSIFFDQMPPAANFGEDQFGQYIEWQALIHTRTAP